MGTSFSEKQNFSEMGPLPAPLEWFCNHVKVLFFLFSNIKMTGWLDGQAATQFGKVWTNCLFIQIRFSLSAVVAKAT